MRDLLLAFAMLGCSAGCSDLLSINANNLNDNESIKESRSNENQSIAASQEATTWESMPVEDDQLYGKWRSLSAELQGESNKAADSVWTFSKGGDLIVADSVWTFSDGGHWTGMIDHSRFTLYRGVNDIKEITISGSSKCIGDGPITVFGDLSDHW